MITFIIRQGPTPSPTPTSQKRSRAVPDIASTDWDGQHYEVSSTTGATMDLARELVAAGCPEQEWEARGIDHATEPSPSQGRSDRTPGVLRCNGARRFFGRSLHWLAKHVIYEFDKGGMRIRPWNALSADTVHDLRGIGASSATLEAAE